MCAGNGFNEFPLILTFGHASFKTQTASMSSIRPASRSLVYRQLVKTTPDTDLGVLTASTVSRASGERLQVVSGGWRKGRRGRCSVVTMTDRYPKDAQKCLGDLLERAGFLLGQVDRVGEGRAGSWRGVWAL